MKILVANLGSTSFKYRLFDMADERQMARGGVERIGAEESLCFVEVNGQRKELTAEVPDHAVAVRQCLAQLTDPASGCLRDATEVAAIGFKAVHGGGISGVQRVTDEVLAAMEAMNDIAPAHNPPYIKAMRLLAQKLPGIPLVAAFETGFHATVPDRLRYYPAPKEWGDELHVKRWGFHGASHRYIAGRTAELLQRDDARVISCHLGGSNSLCAIRGRQSHGDVDGDEPAVGHPAQQSDWRLRPVRPAAAHACHRPDARAGARHAGQPVWTAGTKRFEWRCAGSGRGRCAGTRAGPVGVGCVRQRDSSLPGWTTGRTGWT